MTKRKVGLSEDEYVKSLCRHSSTLNFGFSSLKDKYSKVALSDNSSIGKILLNTFVSPFLNDDLDSSLGSDDKNCLYYFFCTSIRFGIDRVSFNLPKFFLIFFFSVNDKCIQKFTSLDAKIKI